LGPEQAVERVMDRSFCVSRAIGSVLLAMVLLAGCESSRVMDQVQEAFGFPRSVTPSPSPSAPAQAPAPPATAEAPAEPEARQFDLSPLLRGTGSEGMPVETGPQAPLPPARSYRIGLLLPLSGSFASVGRALRNSAQLALFDAANRRFEIVFEDTQGTPEGAMAAAQSALGDGVSLIVGPLLSPEVAAIMPLVRAANVPIIAFTNDRGVAGNGVFTMGLLPGDQVRRVVTYARSRGLTRFAVLAPDNPYGNTVVEAMQQAVTSVGGELAQVKTYDPNTADFNPVVKEIADYDRRRGSLIAQRRELEAKGATDEVARLALRRLETLQTIGELPYQALIVADSGKRLQEIAALLPFFDVDPAKVKMLGTQLWDVPGLGAEPALVGGWFAAPPPDNHAAFEAKYRAAFGETPPRIASLAYDATALAALLARSESSAPFDVRNLTSPNGFMGHDGIFRLTPSGVVERGLAVMEVQTRGFRVISPAPEAFTSPVTN
jgi:branched-chain amino acid transport system substrate-binding protein